jgi:hypothetical protein
MEEQVLVEQIKDTFSAEKQALRCMQKAVRKASTPALRDGIQMHIEQTQVQIERVEQIMESLKVRPGRKVCEAMRGLVEDLPDRLRELIPSIGGHEIAVVVHNDAVVQGLSAVPYMRKTSNWAILTIGTSLGNAHLSRLLLGTMAALFCYGGWTNLPALLLVVVLAWIATSLRRPL